MKTERYQRNKKTETEETGSVPLYAVKVQQNIETGGYFPIRLQFFAKEGKGGEKTEQPTAKKLKEARKEGQVAKSQELINAASLLTLFLVLKTSVSTIGNNFIGVFDDTYGIISTLSDQEFSSKLVSGLLKDYLFKIVTIVLPIFISAMLVTFLINIYQVKWKPTSKPLRPKFSKLNPISGFKKIVSAEKLIELLKSIAKIIVISVLVYSTLKDEYGLLGLFYEMKLEAAIIRIGSIVIDLGMKISLLFLVIGVADYFYQKHKFRNDMKMTKQEIKDEYKQSEGDPQIKGKIRHRMREASRRRMMQRLPEADVVITNPTHFACALLYDKEKSDAPILVAKGADLVAQKIRETAKEYKIPVVENKPLARMLYYNVDLEQEIPPELYQMAAEVLAYVYSLKNQAG